MAKLHRMIAEERHTPYDEAKGYMTLCPPPLGEVRALGRTEAVAKDFRAAGRSWPRGSTAGRCQTAVGQNRCLCLPRRR